MQSHLCNPTSPPYDDIERRPGVFDHMLVSFPALMVRVRQFTIPLLTQVSSIQIIPLHLTRCLYINGNYTWEELRVTSPLRWPPSPR